MSTPRRRRRWLIATSSATLMAVLTVAPRLGLTAAKLPDPEAACRAGHPFFVTACYRGQARASQILIKKADPRAAAVALFSETANDTPQWKLASFQQVGAVWGLAYSPVERAIYASAFHKRQLPFGPGGPGAIYHVDLATGAVSLFTTVPDAGIDHHGQMERGDKEGRGWAGRTSLGDLELSGNQSQLFVVNLADRRIYRFGVPSGQLLGSFPHGAAAEPWAEEARPFGLASRGGYLYHGVVRSGEQSQRRSTLEARVYRSRADGSAMAAVAAFSLAYRRGFLRFQAAGLEKHSLNWQAWSDGPYPQRGNYVSMYPMPLLTDIEFDQDGNMLLGLRDRRSDTSTLFVSAGHSTSWADYGVGRGDLLRGQSMGEGWAFNPATEYFHDGYPMVSDESTLGGLAWQSDGGLVISGAYDHDSMSPVASTEGAAWFDAVTGGRLAIEHVCYPRSFNSAQRLFAPLGSSEPVSVTRYFPGQQTVGDVEILCPSPVLPTPSLEPSPTQLAAATEAAKAFVAAMALPRDRVAVVSFNQTARVVSQLSGDARELAARIDALDVAQGTRIDRGLSRAMDQLVARQDPTGRRAAMVLLSDGIQYEEPDTALAAAAAARQAGVRLYAVGLGPDASGAFLIELAGDRSSYYHAPREDQLVDIYRALASLIPCPPDRYWGRR